MSAPKVRLLVTAALFLAWIGWLGYLAATTTKPEVISRSQFLVCDLFVIADLTGTAERPDAMITVQETGGRQSTVLRSGSSPTIANLPDVDRGWSGPGRYIVPLTHKRDGTWELTAVPITPGYPPKSSDEPAERLRIYRAEARTLAQLRQL